jgi:hypothetical protein
MRANGADVSAQALTGGFPVDGEADKLVPLAEAAERLCRSVWTLKRLYAAGELPVVFIRNRWFVPESFLREVFTAMRPGRAGDFAEVADAWFRANRAEAEREAMA